MVFCILTCATLSISANEAFEKYNPDCADVTNFTTYNTINVYINSVNAQNTKLAETDFKDIATTITFSESMSDEELERYINSYNIEAVQLQARGYDKDGNRITFFSKTDMGIKMTFQLLKNMAKDDNIQFAGVIGMYALTDSAYINAIQNDTKTLLIDTSADKRYENKNSVSTYQTNLEGSIETTRRNFVNSVAWDAENLGIVFYDTID